MAMSINDAMYYYVKNLQGDITKIVNHQGKVMVEYTYDVTKPKSQKNKSITLLLKKLLVQLILENFYKRQT